MSSGEGVSSGASPYSTPLSPLASPPPLALLAPARCGTARLRASPPRAYSFIIICNQPPPDRALYTKLDYRGFAHGRALSVPLETCLKPYVAKALHEKDVGVVEAELTNEEYDGSLQVTGS